MPKRVPSKAASLLLILASAAAALAMGIGAQSAADHRAQVRIAEGPR